MRANLSAVSDKAALLEAWSRLYAGAPPNFFQSPPFVSAFLEAAGPQMQVLRVVNDAGDPIALGLISAPTGGPLRGRDVRFAETGSPGFDRLYVEYVDFLLAPGEGDSARDCALDALIENARWVSEFVFRNVRPAFVAACARAAERHGLEERILQRQPTFQVDLRGDGSAASASLRTKIRRSLRRYEERGPVALTQAQSASDRRAAFEEMIALHEPYWRQRGAPGAFADPALRKFHERLIATAPAAADLLRMTAGSDTVGVLYNFIAGDRVYNYQSGFRTETDNQFAPGFSTHALAIEHYRRAGHAVYDLMAGDADYKRRLGSEGETLTSLVIERRSVRQRARSLARRLRSARTRQT